MNRAVVLAGGLGTRLRPYTVVLPKPLVPIGDRPVLDIVVRQLRHHEFDQITIATGYLAELVEAFFRDGSRYHIPIDYYREEEPLGTVGALSLIDGLTEDFLVMNGDVLTDIDYAALLDRHRAERCRGYDRHDQAPDPGLPRRARAQRRGRSHTADGLPREARARARGAHGRVLLLAPGPRAHRAG